MPIEDRVRTVLRQRGSLPVGSRELSRRRGSLERRCRLLHLQHRCHHALRLLLVRIAEQFGRAVGTICQDRPNCP